jgi:hypothetical protein
MDYERAIEVLKNLLARHPLDAEEKEAVMKARREKSTRW